MPQQKMVRLTQQRASGRVVDRIWASCKVPGLVRRSGHGSATANQPDSGCCGVRAGEEGWVGVTGVGGGGD